MAAPMIVAIGTTRQQPIPLMDTLMNSLARDWLLMM
jgi:hypothetical protein